MLLRVPPRLGRLVALLEQQPLRPATPIATPLHEHEPAPQLLAVEVEVQVAGLDRRQRIVVVAVGLGQRPPPPVPHDDVATAVLAGRDDALEVEVVERMVLHVHGHPLHGGVERRALRHGPAGQHPGDLEAQVVVQAGRPVALHDEAPPVRRRGSGAGRLGRDREVALGTVRSQGGLRRGKVFVRGVRSRLGPGRTGLNRRSTPPSWGFHVRRR